MEKLKLQLKLLPDAVKKVILDGIPIHQVARVQTLCDVLNTQNCLKMLMSEVPASQDILNNSSDNYQYGTQLFST